MGAGTWTPRFQSHAAAARATADQTQQYHLARNRRSRQRAEAGSDGFRIRSGCGLGSCKGSFGERQPGRFTARHFAAIGPYLVFFSPEGSLAEAHRLLLRCSGRGGIRPGERRFLQAPPSSATETPPLPTSPPAREADNSPPASPPRQPAASKTLNTRCSTSLSSAPTASSDSTEHVWKHSPESKPTCSAT